MDLAQVGHSDSQFAVLGYGFTKDAKRPVIVTIRALHAPLLKLRLRIGERFAAGGIVVHESLPVLGFLLLSLEHLIIQKVIFSCYIGCLLAGRLAFYLTVSAWQQ